MSFSVSAIGTKDELMTHLENSFNENHPNVDDTTREFFGKVAGMAEDLVGFLAKKGDEYFQIAAGGHAYVPDSGSSDRESLYVSVSAINPPAEETSEGSAEEAPTTEE